ncbi:COMM domain-containing protein 2-like [Amphiura filiformis]|uniref:COMM domain-containing protein 2-like n=1 Tax=Amphiura filiformis TaxID=82378 RepID=UPI003B21EEF3
MLLVLEDEHKEHLAFLTKVELSVLQEFCHIAMEFMRKGSNPKVYLTAAQKLDVDADTVRHGVEGLMYLLTESAKLMVNEIDFHDSILTLGFSKDLKEELLRLYKEHCKEIRAILSKMSMDLPHYHNLEWRLDVELASRSSSTPNQSISSPQTTHRRLRQYEYTTYADRSCQFNSSYTISRGRFSRN